MIDIIPSLIATLAIVLFVVRYQHAPIYWSFLLICSAYLIVFPTLNFILSREVDAGGYVYFQLIFLTFFVIPLLITLHLHGGRLRKQVGQHQILEGRNQQFPYRLSAIMPYAFILAVILFWYVTLKYDLFIRRVGFEALEERTANVPLALLFTYRITVETSFFIISFLGLIIRFADSRHANVFPYRAAFYTYVATFGLYFAVNSRLQFIILMVVLFCTQPRLSTFVMTKVRPIRLAIALSVLIIGLTLFRELSLEHNDRIDVHSAWTILGDTGRLIASRLDSVTILYSLRRAGFNVFEFNSSGIVHTIVFYTSFFNNPELYRSIKESLITSPSVEIVTRRLGVTLVDFPKSMLLDVVLSFGVIGILIQSIVIGYTISFLQKSMFSLYRFSFFNLLALFSLPIILQFEKEALGMLLSLLKWMPMLLAVYLFRPRPMRTGSVR